MNIAIVVPGRLASQRFPKKLLFPVKNKPLILWTAERIAKQAPEYPLYFAIGEKELGDVLTDAGFKVILTDPDLPSGTDRIAAANREIKADGIINVQADEPLVTRAQIEQLAELIRRPESDMATLGTIFRSVEAFRDPNCVKVIRDSQGYALYFSRAPIPYMRETKGEVDEAWLKERHVLHHLGMYAYHAGFLEEFGKLQQGKLEQIEKLEQLRVLERGFSIGVGLSDSISLGVDVREDAAKLEKALDEAL